MAARDRSGTHLVRRGRQRGQPIVETSGSYDDGSWHHGGADTLTPGPGNDKINGGGGSDTITNCES
jgi:RTX calcium-binding nonapeptide repeat (4 copies)